MCKNFVVVLKVLSLLALIQWRNSYYRTFYGPILCFLVTFYFINTKKFDQKAEYGTKKCLIVRISPLYHWKISKRYPIFLNYWIMAEKTSLPSLFQIQTKNSNKSFNFEGRRFSFCIQIAYLIGDISYFYSWAFRLTILELSEKYFSSIFSLGHIMSKFGLFWTKWVLSWWKEISFSQIYQKLLVWDLSSKKNLFNKSFKLLKSRGQRFYIQIDRFIVNLSSNLERVWLAYFFEP